MSQIENWVLKTIYTISPRQWRVVCLLLFALGTHFVSGSVWTKGPRAFWWSEQTEYQTVVTLLGMCFPCTFKSLAHWEMWLKAEMCNFLMRLSYGVDVASIAAYICISWKPRDLSNGNSTSVMACCRQDASHYFNQCWPRSVPWCGITRPHFKCL